MNKQTRPGEVHVTAAVEVQPIPDIWLRADGDANFYHLLKGNNWVAAIHMNGEYTTLMQEAMLTKFAAFLRDPGGAQKTAPAERRSTEDRLWDAQPRVIKLDVFDIVITVLPEGGTQITSSLHDTDEPEEMKTAINGVELLIQTHAEAGLDVNSPAYLQGIEASIEVIWARFPDVAHARQAELRSTNQ